jgi:hypothetical protein
MVSLVDLFRYKKEIMITDPVTGRDVKKIWVRVLGDMDLNKAYKAARLASAAKRDALRNPETEDYKDEVLGVVELSPEEKREVIKTARLSNIISEAISATIRPELPKLEEVAVDPDAATLEELENLDKEEIKVEKEYQSKIDEYVTLRTQEIDIQLQSLSVEELDKQAMQEVSVLVPFALFMTELNVNKALYGTFQDKDCKTKEFETADDFRQLPKAIQDLIIDEINNLEIHGSEIKN